MRTHEILSRTGSWYQKALQDYAVFQEGNFHAYGPASILIKFYIKHYDGLFNQNLYLKHCILKQDFNLHQYSQHLHLNNLLGVCF